MPQYVALTRADGTIALMLVPGSPSPQDIAAEIAKMPETFVSVRPINAGQIPASREFRHAWIDAGGGALQHDMPKAREIHRTRIREQRAPRLATLDTDAIRAIEDNDPTKRTQVMAAKQRLRDAPADARIEAAATVAELAALSLNVLAAP